MAAAKTDPNDRSASEAINYLARSSRRRRRRRARGDPAQRSRTNASSAPSVRALMRSDNARARASMRALIDRKDAPVNLRIEAINSFNTDRATTEDAAYLRGLYATRRQRRMKHAIIDARRAHRRRGERQWVLGFAQESRTSRASPRHGDLAAHALEPSPVADLIKLYDAADSYDIRSRIISILGNRKEPEAADKLVDIVRNSTVINIRTQAINALHAQERSAQRSSSSWTFSTGRSHDPTSLISARRRARRGGRLVACAQARVARRRRARRPRAVHLRVAPRRLRQRPHVDPDGTEQLQRHVLRQRRRLRARSRACRGPCASSSIAPTSCRCPCRRTSARPIRHCAA